MAFFTPPPNRMTDPAPVKADGAEVGEGPRPSVVRLATCRGTSLSVFLDQHDRLNSPMTIRVRSSRRGFLKSAHELGDRGVDLLLGVAHAGMAGFVVPCPSLERDVLVRHPRCSVPRPRSSARASRHPCRSGRYCRARSLGFGSAKRSNALAGVGVQQPVGVFERPGQRLPAWYSRPAAARRAGPRAGARVYACNGAEPPARFHAAGGGADGRHGVGSGRAPRRNGPNSLPSTAAGLE